MSRPFTEAELEAYLDESLPGEDMARMEKALRDDPKLVEYLATINARRDAGLHSLGEIWRRHRVTCPTREQLGSYLLGALPEEMSAYLAFHIEAVGCRYCQANLEDLKAQEAEAADAVETRRRRYFQSSAGYLRGPRKS